MNRFQALLARIKTLEDVGTAFAIAGFVLFGLGSFLNLDFMANLGFAAFGAGGVAWGVNAMQRGEMSALRGFQVIERISGFLARAWGLVFVLGGLGLMGYGILSVLNPRSPLPAPVRQFFATAQGYGVLLLAGSIVGIIFALSLIFASDTTTRNAAVRFISSLPGRLFGIVLLVIAIALALVSILQIFEPTTFDTLTRILYDTLGLPGFKESLP